MGSGFFARAEVSPVAARACPSAQQARTAGFPSCGASESRVLERPRARLRVGTRVNARSRLTRGRGIAEAGASLCSGSSEAAALLLSGGGRGRSVLGAGSASGSLAAGGCAVSPTA